MQLFHTLTVAGECCVCINLCSFVSWWEAVQSVLCYHGDGSCQGNQGTVFFVFFFFCLRCFDPAFLEEIFLNPSGGVGGCEQGEEVIIYGMSNCAIGFNITFITWLCSNVIWKIRSSHSDLTGTGNKRLSAFSSSPQTDLLRLYHPSFQMHKFFTWCRRPRVHRKYFKYSAKLLIRLSWEQEIGHFSRLQLEM